MTSLYDRWCWVAVVLMACDGEPDVATHHLARTQPIASAGADAGVPDVALGADSGASGDVDEAPDTTDTGAPADTAAADTLDAGKPIDTSATDVGPDTIPEDILVEPTGPRACYPGPDETWDVCLPLVDAALAGAGYTYPASNDARYAPPDHYLDLQATSADTALAANFVLGELAQAFKGRYAVVSPGAVMHFQRVRETLGVPLGVNSGYRSPGYNAGIAGSATYSRHMYGDAADVGTGGATTLQAIVDACNAEGADFVSLYTAHVHCDWRDDPLPGDFWEGGATHAAPGLATIDPWLEIAADVTLERDPALDEVRLAARWVGFDEGEPWVRWVIEADGYVEVIEPATAIVVRGAARVSWSVGGVVAGQVELD